MATLAGRSEVWKNDAIELASNAENDSEASPKNKQNADGFKSTYDDAQAMRRMGRSQELVRHYRLFSMVSFIGIATAAWEMTLFQISPALIDGGLPSLMYSNIWIFTAFIPVVLSKYLLGDCLFYQWLILCVYRSCRDG